MVGNMSGAGLVGWLVGDGFEIPTAYFLCGYMRLHEISGLYLACVYASVCHCDKIGDEVRQTRATRVY